VEIHEFTTDRHSPHDYITSLPPPSPLDHGAGEEEGEAAAEESTSDGSEDNRSEGESEGADGGGSGGGGGGGGGSSSSVCRCVESPISP